MSKYKFRTTLALASLLVLWSSSSYALFGPGVNFDLSPFSEFIGSFGGDINCPKNPSHIPVILVHGNADSSLGWTKEINNESSFTKQLKNAGYTNCDIFAVSYLSISEQVNPTGNYHELKKMTFLKDYIEMVMKSTGQHKVDIVTHSLGVTLTLETLQRFNLFKNVRKFVSIAGALHGLQSCLKTGSIIPTISTCAAVINRKNKEFGFWPDGLLNIANPRMGNSNKGFALFPSLHPNTLFYSISAGLSDEVICANSSALVDASCQYSTSFKNENDLSNNIVAQVHIGKAPNPLIGIAVKTMGGDIADGIGHIRARSLSGPIVSQMLLTDCKGVQCCDKYTNSCQQQPTQN
ncbi:MAG: hypothetical protein WA160_05905 [Pseudobdellovibrio sp.]